MISTSEVMPCSAQKSSISWVSRDAADDRAGQGAPAHDQVGGGGGGVRLAGRSDQDHYAVPLQEHEEGVQVVGRGDGVENEMEAARVPCHLRVVLGQHHLVGPEAVRVLC